MSQELERFRLQLAEVGDFRSGSWEIGAQGIEGVTPTDYTEGDGAPLQAMLEGIVTYVDDAVGGAGFDELIDDRVADLIQDTDSITWTYDDVGNTLEAAVDWSAMTDAHVTTALGYTPVNRAGDTMTGFLSAHADPSSAMHYTTKQYVDALAAGIQLKDPVVAATTANITLSGAQTIDGVSVIAGDRVLVKNQTDATENGIYVAASGAWSRSTDMDLGTEFNNALTFVQGGTAHGNEQWRVTTTGTITLGSTAIAWGLFFASEDLSFTSPLSKSGGVVSLAGLSSVGSAHRLVSVNAGATAWEYKELLGTTNRVTVTPAAGSFTLTLPQDIHTGAAPQFAGATLTGDIVFSGGTTYSIRTGTSDGSDNARLVLYATSAANASRGAYITVHGNEHAGAGSVVLSAGNIAGGVIGFYTGNEVRRGGFAEGGTFDVVGVAQFASRIELTGGSGSGTYTSRAEMYSDATAGLVIVGRAGSSTSWVLARGSDGLTVLDNPASSLNVRAYGSLLLPDNTGLVASTLNRTMIGRTGTNVLNIGENGGWTAINYNVPSGAAHQFGVAGTTRFQVTGSGIVVTGTGVFSSTLSASNLSGTNTGDQTITLTGDVTGSGTGSFAATIANNAVTDAKLRDSVALSVIGRAANSTGDPADIAAGTDAHVLRRSGTALGFGTIGDASISALAWSKLTGTPTTLSGYGITDAVPASRTISTTGPLAGGGDLSANRTLSITGLSGFGVSNQIPGVNSGATAWEYKTFAGTANQVVVTHGTGAVTFSTPQNIHAAATPTFAGLTLSGLTASRLVVTNGSSVLAVNAALTTNGMLYASAAGGIASTGVASNGQLLIGTAGAPVLGAITGTANRVTVTLGSGTIALTGPQDIHAAASPSFNRVNLTAAGGFSSSGVIVAAATAGMAWQATGAAANNRWWDILSGGTTWNIRALNDAGTAAVAISIGRSGTTITDIGLSATTTTVFGAFTVSGGLATFGSVSLGGTLTGTGDWIFDQSTHLIRTNTSDGADNRRIGILGAGSTGSNRGAAFYAYGNEYASNAGSAYMEAGAVSTGHLYFFTNGVERTRIENDGDFFYSGNFMGVGPALGSVGSEAMRVGKDGVGSLMVMQGNASGNNNLVWHFRHTNSPSSGQTGQALDFYFEMQGMVSGVEDVRRAGRFRMGKEGDFTTTSTIQSYAAIYTTNGNVEQLGFYQNRGGQVAIRHTVPSTELDVNGHINAGGTFENSAGYHRVISALGTDHARFRLRTSNTFGGSFTPIDASFAVDDSLGNNVRAWIGTTTAHAFTIFANSNSSTPRMHFHTSGYVGVNTTVPQTFLGSTMVSASWDRIFNIRSGSSGGNGAAILALEGTQYADLWMADQNASPNQKWMVLRTDGGTTTFYTHSDAGSIQSTLIQMRHSDGNLLTGRISNNGASFAAFYNVETSGVPYFQAMNGATINVRLAPTGSNFFERDTIWGQDATAIGKVDVRLGHGSDVIASWGGTSGLNSQYPAYMYISAINTLNAGYNAPGDAIHFWLNYRGYQNGTSYYRDVIFGDGKGNVIMKLDGSHGCLGIGTGSANLENGNRLEVTGNTSLRGDFSVMINGASIGTFFVKAVSGNEYVQAFAPLYVSDTFIFHNFARGSRFVTTNPTSLDVTGLSRLELTSVISGTPTLNFTNVIDGQHLLIINETGFGVMIDGKWFVGPGEESIYLIYDSATADWWPMRF